MMTSRAQLLAHCSVSLSLTALLAGAHAQEAIYRTPLTPEASMLTGTETVEKFFNWGPVQLRPKAMVSATYDDNVRLQRRDQIEDLIWAFSPGIVAGIGDMQERLGHVLAIDYTPSFLVFTSNDEFNAINHDVNLMGQLQTPKLTLRLDQAYQDLQGGVKEVGDWAERQIYLTRVFGRYAYSEKTAFGLNARQSINIWQEFNSFNEWAVEGFADYSVTPKLTVGLGSGALWRDAENNPNMVSEQVLGRASYYLTGKIVINASGGLEFRQFQGGEEQGPAFVYNIGAAYRPLENTVFSLESYRRDTISINPYFFGQNVTVTGFSVSARQKFLHKYMATLTTGYENADYNPIASGVTAQREDDYVFVNLALDANFTEKWTVGAFYNFRNNDSTTEQAGVDRNAYDFANHQVGLRTTYKF